MWKFVFGVYLCCGVLCFVVFFDFCQVWPRARLILGVKLGGGCDIRDVFKLSEAGLETQIRRDNA